MHGPRKKPGRLESRLRALALSYPEAREEFPWGERAFKVAGKTFVFLGSDAAGLSMAVKLPESRDAALALPFTEPTHYGLGKSGWVTAKLREEDDPLIWLLETWIAESYRTIAPRRLTEKAAPPTAKSARSAKAPVKKAAAKKPAPRRKPPPRTGTRTRPRASR
ncbi:MAG: MmcQ/YjbR family DNA-binding protein [Acidobacteriota bacterium]